MDGQTQIEILALNDQSAQLSVMQGTVYVRVRSLPEGENFEIDTPNLAYRAAYPGDYRIDVDAERGNTRVTIHSGTGAVYGEAGQALPMGGGQQITFRGRGLVQVATQESPPQDNFDRWAADATGVRTSPCPRAMCRAKSSATSSSTPTANGRRTRPMVLSGIRRGPRPTGRRTAMAVGNG